MPTGIKPTAIPLAGYDYQNLIGLQLLRDWLEKPATFSWVKFEADESETAPKGLDDIVAKCVDGAFLYWQVKFTTDPGRPALALSWSWLLHRSGQRRSLIQKWHHAYSQLRGKPVAEVALVTNRIPDPDFLLTLSGDKVLWPSISPAQRALLIEQIGSEESAVEFLDVFQFRHSYSGIGALEGALRDRFIDSVTDSAGWYALRSEAVKWAIYRNSPPPAGEITLSTLQHILATGRPTPLPQDYAIPRDYELPNEQFHSELLARVRDSRAPITIVWGSPGKGKSTYLSYVCEELKKDKVPTVRHHYFLGPEDRSTDRFSFVAVKNTLLFQMRNEHGEAVQHLPQTSSEDLHAWLEACGRHYQAKGLPFVVVLDGLDHVWREAGHEAEGIAYLFKQLIPVPPHVVLLIGTQRVEEQLFPASLRQEAREDDWVPMPSLSQAAIRRWLEKRAQAGEFDLPKEDDWRSRELDSITDALFKISGGHPLHLIFSMRMVEVAGERVDQYAIEALPQCPTGDIRDYYNDLWLRLAPQGKELMHLLAGTAFPWPLTGPGECLGHREVGEALKSISHLLHIGPLGIVPFHGSIYAFVRTTEGHDEVVRRLAPKVVIWLERMAPPYLRWGWLWSMGARTGDIAPLVDGPGRAWARNAFELAYPRSQIQAIVDEAESNAFASDDLVRALQLRWLWTRVANAADYQAYDFAEYFELSLLCNPDTYVLNLHVSSAETLASDELAALARALSAFGRKDEFRRCFDALNRRLQYAFETGANPEGDSRKVLAALVKVIPLVDEARAEKVVRFVSQFSEKDAYLADIVTALGGRGELIALAEYFEEPVSNYVRRGLEQTIVRAACLLGTDITKLGQERFAGNPLTRLWMLMHKEANPYASAPTWDTVKLSEKHISGESIVLLRQLFTDYFFYALVTVYEARALSNAPKPPLLGNREAANEALRWLQQQAFEIGRALVHRSLPSFEAMIKAMPPTKAGTYSASNEYRIFQRAVVEITLDLWFCLIGVNGRGNEVPAGEIPSRIEDDPELFGVFLNEYQTRGLKLLSSAAAKRILDTRLSWLASHPTVFNERIDSYVQVGRVAHWHGLSDLANAALSRATEGLVGYGWRKDMSIYEALDSIEATLKAGSPKISKWLKEIAPAALGITEYTDGDETSQAVSEYLNLLRRQAPQSAAERFATLMKMQNWRDADRVLRAALADADLRDPVVQGLVRTLVDPESLGVMEKRAESDPVAEDLLKEQRGLVSQLAETPSQSSNGLKKLVDISVDVAHFGHDQSAQLLERLKGEQAYSHETHFLQAWFDHWVQNEKSAELLKHLEQYLTHEPSNRVLESLADKAFDLSLKVEGAPKAYRWLVAAHIALHGWEPYFTDESRAFRRFDAVARHYKKSWLQFIHDTSRSPYRWSKRNRTIGQRKLVQFLIAVGQNDLAEAITEAIVALILEDVAEQPLAGLAQQ